MTVRAINLIFLLLTESAVWGDAPPHPQPIQDLKTGIIYYIESDSRHMAAIGPGGKLLWCKIVAPLAAQGLSFDLEGEAIRVEYFHIGNTNALFDKKTGAAFDVTVQ